MYHYGKYLRVSPFRQPFQLIHANTEKVMKRFISVNQHNYLEKNTFGRSLLRMVVKNLLINRLKLAQLPRFVAHGESAGVCACSCPRIINNVLNLQRANMEKELRVEDSKCRKNKTKQAVFP